MADEPDEKPDGEVRLVKGAVVRGRRGPSPRVLVAGGVVAALVAVGIGVAVWPSGSDEAESNGIADASLGEIGAEIDRGFRELTSVRVQLTPADESGLDFDLRIDDAGDCSGTFGPDGQTAELLQVDDRFYFRPGEGYWAQNTPDPSAEGAAETTAQLEALRAAIGDSWVDGSAAGEDQPLRDLCSGGIEALVPEAYDADAFENDGWSIGGEGDIAGTPALSLTKGAAATVWVATVGEPWVLRAEAAQGATAATYTFSEQNEPLELTAPSADEVVTAEELTAAISG